MRLAASMLSWVLLCAGGGVAVAAETTTMQRDGVLGTSFEMQVVGDAAPQAVEAALAEIERLEGLLSTWREDSELSAYNAGRIDRQALSRDTAAVLGLCERWREITQSAFSCRLGGLIEQWRHADDGDRMPDRVELRRQARTLAALEWPADGKLDPQAGLRFDVDGLAKGYILDRALAMARTAAPHARGIRIDIGGDAVYWGSGEAGEAWMAGIADPVQPIDNGQPLASVRLQSQAIAASGHRSRGYRIGRRRLSHILDPQDGWPLSYAPAAIVVAGDATTADALATALTVLPIREGLALVDGIDGAAALIVSDSGIPFASTHWPALLDPQSPSAAVPSNSRQVLIEYAIPQAAGERYRQPYLVLWVEREDGSAVRQLHVLGDRSRWLGELPRWWRHYGRNDPAGSLGLARPTRAPGRYTLAWEGRDDLGRVQPTGNYVLRVEAAREHGGHDVVSIPIVLGDTALDIEHEGQGEIGDIVIRYAER